MIQKFSTGVFVPLRMNFAKNVNIKQQVAMIAFFANMFYAFNDFRNCFKNFIFNFQSLEMISAIIHLKKFVFFGDMLKF